MLRVPGEESCLHGRRPYRLGGTPRARGTSLDCLAERTACERAEPLITVIKLFVVLAAVVGAIALADGRFESDDLVAAQDVVSHAYDDARAALADANGGVDPDTRRELEQAKEKLDEAAVELSRAGDNADGEEKDALEAARKTLAELEQQIDDALG